MTITTSLTLIAVLISTIISVLIYGYIKDLGMNSMERDCRKIPPYSEFVGASSRAFIAIYTPRYR